MEVVNKRALSLLMGHMAKAHKANTPATLKRGLRAVGPEEHTAKAALTYLDAFGYLSERLADWKDIQLGDIVEGVKDFQSFFGLKRSGTVCAKTVRAMQMPRCGCPDVVRKSDARHRAVKEFAQSNLPRWTKTGIVYAIESYVGGISKPDFESAIYSSFQNWCRVAGVSVEPARNAGQQVDIVITTGRGQQDNFDGPGGVLAWAYMPDGNDQQLVMKFDLDETWTLNPASRGVLLQNVATHEFGHLMGLDHSRLQSALMAPYYNAAVAVPQQQDDVPRVQARYGPPLNAAGPLPQSPPAPGVSTLTVQGSFGQVSLDGRRLV